MQPNSAHPSPPPPPIPSRPRALSSSTSTSFSQPTSPRSPPPLPPQYAAAVAAAALANAGTSTSTSTGSGSGSGSSNSQRGTLNMNNQAFASATHTLSPSHFHHKNMPQKYYTLNTKALSNSDVNSAYHRFLSCESAVQQLSSHLSTYIRLLRETLSIQTFLSSDLLYFHDVHSAHRSQVDMYVNLMATMSSKLTSSVIDPLTQMSTHLNEFLDEFPAVKRRKDAAEKKRTETEVYARKLKELQLKSTKIDPNRLERKQKKLHSLETHSAHLWSTLSNALQPYAVSAAYPINKHFSELMKAQHEWNSSCAQLTAPLTSIAENIVEGLSSRRNLPYDDSDGLSLALEWWEPMPEKETSFNSENRQSDEIPTDRFSAEHGPGTPNHISSPKLTGVKLPNNVSEAMPNNSLQLNIGTPVKPLNLFSTTPTHAPPSPAVRIIYRNPPFPNSVSFEMIHRAFHPSMAFNLASPSTFSPPAFMATGHLRHLMVDSSGEINIHTHSHLLADPFLREATAAALFPTQHSTLLPKNGPPPLSSSGPTTHLFHESSSPTSPSNYQTTSNELNPPPLPSRPRPPLRRSFTTPKIIHLTDVDDDSTPQTPTSAAPSVNFASMRPPPPSVSVPPPPEQPVRVHLPSPPIPVLSSVECMAMPEDPVQPPPNLPSQVPSSSPSPPPLPQGMLPKSPALVSLMQSRRFSLTSATPRKSDTQNNLHSAPINTQEEKEKDRRSFVKAQKEMIEKSLQENDPSRKSFIKANPTSPQRILFPIAPNPSLATRRSGRRISVDTSITQNSL